MVALRKALARRISRTRTLCSPSFVNCFFPAQTVYRWQLYYRSIGKNLKREHKCQLLASADFLSTPPNVRFRVKADMPRAMQNVRYWPEDGVIGRRLLWIN